MKHSILAVLCMGLCYSFLFAGVEENVQYIRDIYQQVNQEIDEGSLYMTVVDINSDDLPYPAVGIYHPVLTFYFGFSEEEPYPDNLMKAHLVVDRAAYHEYTEFLYNGYGELIFVYVTGRPDMPECRFYFYQGELVQLIQDSETFTSFTSEQLEMSDTLWNQGERLEGTFQRLFF